MAENEKDTKQILVVYFTQTGQLEALINSVIKPLQKVERIELSFLKLEPETPYPFPWPFFTFLDTMPACILEKGRVLKPFGDAIGSDGVYDLIVLAYQPWFLSPVPPIVTFLGSDAARRLFAETPVITLVGCRGMWLMAQQKIKRMLSVVNAQWLGHIAVCDQGNAVASLVTTPRWMFTGRKEAFWRIFPPAGIAQSDIEKAARFGEQIKEALLDGRVATRQPFLDAMDAAPIDPRLIASERVGCRVFGFWAHMFERAGPEGCAMRKALICLFLGVFFPLLILFVPLRIFVFALLGPMLRKRLERQSQRYC